MYDAFISLGQDCQTAHQLEINKLKGPSLPFDWVVSPFSSVHALIQNDFADWLQKENVAFVEDMQVGSYVQDTKYRIRFLHDFPLDRTFMQAYDAVRAKYARRAKRFIDLLKTAGRILFIRVDITYVEACAFEAMLHKRFPRLSYDMLALGNDPEVRLDWGLPHVKNMFLPQPEPYHWAGLGEPWQHILSGLLQVPVECSPQPDSLIARLEPLQKQIAIECGQTRELSVRVVNESRVPLGFGPASFGLSYHLFSHDGYLLRWDNERTWFRRALQTGEARDMQVAIAAPPDPGRYRVELDIVWEGVAWLKEKGSPTSTVDILVR